MAYAAVASLLQTVDILLNHHQHSISLQCKNQIISIHQHTCSLQSFIEGFSARVNNWEETIRQVTDRAEQIIELLLSDSLLESRVGSTGAELEKWKCEACYNFDELEKVAGEIESIANRVEGKQTEVTGGSDEELMKIISRLREGSSALETIAIVGIGGIGKTTLATNAYNTPSVVEHFDVRAWSTVSISYDERQIALGLLHSMNKSKVKSVSDQKKLERELQHSMNKSKVKSVSDLEKLERELLQSMNKSKVKRISNQKKLERGLRLRARLYVTNPLLMKNKYFESIYSTSYIPRISNSDDVQILHEILWGKRYLIVLDDISSIEDMDRLRLMLPDNGNGSRIILTTRSLSISNSAHHIHTMGLLDDDRAWAMLQQKIFKGDPCPSPLEYVGEMIARLCRGHPLSIEVVSGVLAADQSVAAWYDVLENLCDNTHNDIPMIPEVEIMLTPFEILNLSYIYLPHYLRPCFLYLVIFPKKEEIRVSKLIKLWVAEGFLNQSECKSFEVVGEECVEDLVRRRLVRLSKKKSNGRIKSITIHDLLWDVCHRRAQEDNFILHHWRFGRLVEASKRQRCRRVYNLSHSEDIVKGVYGSTIRSMFFGEDGQLGIECLVGNVRLLRILDLSNARYRHMPEEIFELFHLRYLAFDGLFSIWEAISNLQNLQTLIICSKKKKRRVFDKLPGGIWRLPQLRHLVMFRFQLPTPNSALENLQTLSSVKNFVCSRENLEMIPNLKKLALLYTKNFRNVLEDYEIDNLLYLQKLEILKIETDWSFVEEHKISCAFPPTLKKLNLCGVKLPWEDMKTVASLPYLEVLKLRKHACIGNVWETSEGGFSHLTFLLIEESNLEKWITKTTHFPKLKFLVLRCCLALLEVPIDIGEIPTLELIELDEQNNRSLLISAKRIQKDRQSLGTDQLQIRVV